MSRISTDDALYMLKRFPGKAGVFCFFCGRQTRQGGLWRGFHAHNENETVEIAVCLRCIDRLGALAGDTWADCSRPISDDQADGLLRLETSFWKALATARKPGRAQ